MARPRSAGYEGQRELILAAAARVFASRGYRSSTMTEVAAACGVSKGTLYHYVRDKQDLLAQITSAHVQRLQSLVEIVQAENLPPREHLVQLVLRFMRIYEGAQAEHRVLTEDVKFLPDAVVASADGSTTSDREQVVQGQRLVVQAVAHAVAALRPDLQAAGQHKPVAMLLFGMMNWTFTWLHADGPLSHEDVAQLVLGVFLGGLPAVQVQHSKA